MEFGSINTILNFMTPLIKIHVLNLHGCKTVNNPAITNNWIEYDTVCR